jgi:hypothetical protein
MDEIATGLWDARQEGLAKNEAKGLAERIATVKRDTFEVISARSRQRDHRQGIRIIA